MRRGECGYDAPYALMMFGTLTAASGIAAATAWAQGAGRGALTFYFLFFFASASSFLYTTRRGKFIEWDRILDTPCASAATNRCSIWAAAGVRC
jgi:cytochrome c biogenesis factor